MRRAEDRLSICGGHTSQPPWTHCWYALAAGGLASLAEPVEFDFAPLIGEDGWAGGGLRHDRPQTVAARPDSHDYTRATADAELPRWARSAPPAEPVPPRPLAPSRPTLAEPAARSPLGLFGAGDDRAGFKRGLLVHRLLQILPDLPPARRQAAAARFLARPVHRLVASEQTPIAAVVLAILDAPEFATLFAPDSRAEVPIVGLVGNYAIAGQIDRLVVGAREALIVDY